MSLLSLWQPVSLPRSNSHLRLQRSIDVVEAGLFFVDVVGVVVVADERCCCCGDSDDAEGCDFVSDACRV